MDAKSFNAQRGQLKRKLSFILNFVKNYRFKKEDEETLMTKFEETVEIQKQYNTLNESLHLVMTEENESEMSSKADEFETQLWATQSKINEVLDSLKPKKDGEPSAGSSGGGSGGEDYKNFMMDFMKMMREVKGESQSIRVPELKLPTFTPGSDYTIFRESFDYIIHNKDRYSNVEKFHYLNMCLPEKLRDELLLKFKLTGEGYTLAYNYLRDKFENNRLNINKHFAEIFNTKSILKESAKDLQSLLDTVSAHVDQLRQIREDEDLFSLLITYLVSTRLDDHTRKSWEIHVKNVDYPKWEDMRQFLSGQCKILERVQYEKQLLKSSDSETSGQSSKPKSSSFKSVLKPTTSLIMTQSASNESRNSTQSKSNNCLMCKGSHKISKCPDFLKLSVNERVQKVKSLNICFNCLGANHRVSECSSKDGCFECTKVGKVGVKHNTLLHYTKPQSGSNNEQSKSDNGKKNMSSGETSDMSLTGCSYSICSKKRVMLPTAIVNVLDKSGKSYQCRALLDSGSQNGFITERMAQILNLKRYPTSFKVQGLSQCPIVIKYCVKARVRSRVNNYCQTMDLLVVPKIAGNIPSEKIEVKNFKLPDGVDWTEMADPTFLDVQPIDMLISAEYFMDLIVDDKKYGCCNSNSNQLYLKKSVFGFVVFGKYVSCANDDNQIQSISCVSTCHDELNTQIKKFWEIERFDSSKSLTAEESFCEELFAKTISRNSEGRFVVTLPTRPNFVDLESNRDRAYKQFRVNEYRLQKEPEKYELYRQFMKEFVALGHMKELKEECVNEKHFYLPHHAVLKPSSTTTKLRVVFNASQKTQNGLSLNDVLCVGPVVQSDLFSILVRFRMNPIMMLSDIQMMYRQFVLSPEQSTLQRIFWRDNMSEDIKSYAITVMIYGIGPASYIATRCLKQLAIIYRDKYPEACRIIEEDTYMDDVFIGAKTRSQATKLQSQIREMLSSAKLNVRKWVSNEPKLLSGLPKEDCEEITVGGKDYVTALGVKWKPIEDKLLISLKPNTEEKVTTKRIVLKNTAETFDPLGILGPVTITARMFQQKLWIMKVDWDDVLDQDLHYAWQKYRDELQLLKGFELDRFVLCHECESFEMHGFSDASQSAYGACIYLRSMHGSQIQVKLLCSRSKVAPLDKRTLPELELCGAELLAQLSNKILSILREKVSRVVLWTDSTIVLSWIRFHPFKLRVFVGNRVASIQRLTNVDDWRHVNSEANPADCLSRGLMPSEILNHSLWMNGPEFLLRSEEYWPKLPSLENSKDTAPFISCVFNVQALQI